MASQVNLRYYLTNIKQPFKGGDLEINKRYIHNFYFIESIENMFLTGAIEFEDTSGFFEALPLTGEESLRVILEQEMKDSQDSSNDINIIKEVEFDLYNVSITETMGNVKGLIYKFILIEKDALNFIRKKFSYSFVQKKISDIIKTVCLNMIKIQESQLEIEDTNDIIDYQIPYWKPSIVIKYLVRLARRNKIPNEGGFLFYSTIGNEDEEKPIKRFVSFASLLEVKPKQQVHEKFYFRKLDMNPMFINNFKDITNPNFCKRSIITNGISGKKYFGIKILDDKSIYHIDKKYSEFVKNSVMLGKTAYLSKDLDEVNSDVEFFGRGDAYLKAEQDYKFRMVIEGFNRREVLLEGSLDRYAGKTIFVEQIGDNKSETYNKQDTGTWIIKTITHHFVQDIFEQKMVILKDSYSEFDAEGHQAI